MPTSAEISQMMVDNFSPEKAKDIDATIQFDLSGEDGGHFYAVISNGEMNVHEGTAEDPRMTLRADVDDWYNVMTGKMNAMQAFMSGKIKISGDMGLAMKMQSMLGG